jgi:hypothetical protein
MELISIRTNTRFIVDYETKNLKPVTEVILLISQPKYSREKDGIYKKESIKELRFETTQKGINSIIGELQATSNALNVFDQLAAGINSMIKSVPNPSEENKKAE